MQAAFSLLVVLPIARSTAPALRTRTGDDKLHHILFLAADDMRPEMSPYGNEYVKTPNFQRLADDGFAFRRAYVQLALCAPSRTVLLTGRRPDTSRVWTIGPYFRETTGKDWVTLPQFFKNNGWRSIGHGKIFHEGNASGFPLDQDQAYGSWSVPFYGSGYYGPWNEFNKTHPNPCKDTCRNPRSNGPVDEPWETFDDGLSTLKAVEWIKNASRYKDPFFLAVGFHRPHIPYIYPTEFEFKGEEKFPPENYYITKNVPVYAPHDWTAEGMRYEDLATLRPKITSHNFQSNLSSLCSAVPLAKQAEMKKSYLSCIQYVDHLVGQLMQALEEEGLYNQTTIIFWGDHGYKLGEHCDWFKHDNFEDSTRIPVLLKPAIGLQPAIIERGRIIEEMVEEVDIFPSLAALAGLDEPKGIEGRSFVPLLDGAKAQWTQRVFWQYRHHWGANRSDLMGYTIRTEAYRYTAWAKHECNLMKPMSNCANAMEAKPNWNLIYGEELYDHKGEAYDKGADNWNNENTNLANRPEYRQQVAALRQELIDRWHTVGIWEGSLIEQLV